MGGLHASRVPDIASDEQYRTVRISRDRSPSSPTSTASDSNGTEMTMPSTPDTPVQDLSFEVDEPPLHIMFLGSSIGNFSRTESSAFLRSLPLRSGCGDTLLLGLDHDNEAAKIELAYNDPRCYTKDFIMNGLNAAGNALGNEHMFDEGKWEYVGKYNEKERTSDLPCLFCRR